MTHRSWQRHAFVPALTWLLVLSAVWVWHVGHRGLFLLDQSIVFDGAWRIAQGQVPYRDFYMPFGPVTFLLPALIFHWAGVSFSSLVAAACVLSLLATAVSVRLGFRLTGSRALGLLAGALTAVWFQAPFGVPWMEQTAFFFDLLALWAIVESRFVARGGVALALLAGLASWLAILSKQNAGGLFVLVCLGCLALPWQRRALRGLFGYALGGLLGAALFAIWLASYSSVAQFRHYWLEVSAETGIARVETWKLVGTAFFQTIASSSVPLFLLASCVGAAALCLLPREEPSEPSNVARFCCAWLALALPQFHNAFQLTTNNDAPNNNAFVGLCLVATLALLRDARAQLATTSMTGGRLERTLHDLLQGWPGRLATVIVAGFTLYSIGDGLLVARDRNVQEFFGARFETPLAVTGAERVVWGEPTRITPSFCGNIGEMCRVSPASEQERAQQFLERRDFERVAQVLAARSENFFVFPDATLLYGLSGRISPQPLLYFHPGQSFLLSDRAALDREIVTALRRNHVKLVVLERASFMGTHRQLDGFPQLQAWLKDEFVPALELGNYRVLEWQPTRTPVALGH